MVAGVASSVACDIFSAGVLLALVMCKFAPAAFAPVAGVLGERDLDSDNEEELRCSLAADGGALPRPAKHLLLALLAASPERRLTATQVRSVEFLSDRGVWV